MVDLEPLILALCLDARDLVDYYADTRDTSPSSNAHALSAGHRDVEDWWR